MAITYLHQAIVDHQDPQAKQTLATCLSNMMKVQAADHQAVSGARTAQSAAVQRLAGTAQGSY